MLTNIATRLVPLHRASMGACSACMHLSGPSHSCRVSVVHVICECVVGAIEAPWQTHDSLLTHWMTLLHWRNAVQSRPECQAMGQQSGAGKRQSNAASPHLLVNVLAHVSVYGITCSRRRLEHACFLLPRSTITPRRRTTTTTCPSASQWAQARLPTSGVAWAKCWKATS